MNTVYKVVPIDGYGRLNSPVAEGAWSHRYELDQLTVPQDTTSRLFAYHTFEQALMYRLARPAGRWVYVYEALTSLRASISLQAHLFWLMKHAGQRTGSGFSKGCQRISENPSGISPRLLEDLCFAQTSVCSKMRSNSSRAIFFL